MSMEGFTNIGGLRKRIMVLEGAAVFDQGAWAQVLMALRGHDCARADAVRRMETAKANSVAAETDDEVIYVPFLDCGWKNADDNACSHPGQWTPECHQFCCPIKAVMK